MLKLSVANLHITHLPGAMFAEFLAPILEYANWANETMIKIPQELVLNGGHELDDQAKQWVTLLWNWATLHDFEYVRFSANGIFVCDLPIFDVAVEAASKKIVSASASGLAAKTGISPPATVALSKRHLPLLVANWEDLSVRRPAIEVTCGPGFLKMYLLGQSDSSEEPVKEANLCYSFPYYNVLFPENEVGNWFRKFFSAVWEYYGEVDVIFKDDAPYDDRLELFMRNPGL